MLYVQHFQVGLFVHVLNVSDPRKDELLKEIDFTAMS